MRHGGRRIVVPSDAAGLVEQLEPVLHARELPERPDDHPGLYPVQVQRESCSEQVHAVVAAREPRSLEHRAYGGVRPDAHLPLVALEPGAAEICRQDGGGVPERFGSGLCGEACLPGVVAVEDGPLPRMLLTEDGPLVLDVGVHVRVPVEVIGEQDGEHRDARCKQTPAREVAELPRRELEHDRVLRGEVAEELQRRHGDVAAEPGAGRNPQQPVVDGRSGRGLALGARHRDHGTAGERQEHRHVGLDGYQPVARSREEGGTRRDRRILDDKIRRLEIGCVVTAEHEPHGQAGEPVERGGERLRPAKVRHRDLGAASCEEERRGEPASVHAQSHHRHAHAGDGSEVTHRCGTPCGRARSGRPPPARCARVRTTSRVPSSSAPGRSRGRQRIPPFPGRTGYGP